MTTSGALETHIHFKTLRGLEPGVKSSLSQPENRPRRTPKLTWLWLRKSAFQPEARYASSPPTPICCQLQPRSSSGETTRSSASSVHVPSVASNDSSAVRCHSFGCSSVGAERCENRLSASRPCSVPQEANGQLAS